MLSKRHLLEICLLGRGSSQCRYLNIETNCCHKKLPGVKKTIDSNCAKFLENCIKQGENPYDKGYPLLDGCRGYPYLENIEQGVDIED